MQSDKSITTKVDFVRSVLGVNDEIYCDINELDKNLRVVIETF